MAAPSSRDGPAMRYRWAVAGLLLLLAALLAWWLWPAAPGSVWAPTTVAYDPDCEKTECVELASMPGAHLGRVPIQLFVQPGVDDPIAQLADCLDSVFLCVEAQGTADPAVFAACVEQSTCPLPCREAFASSAGGQDFKRQSAHFQAIFLDEDGLCVPPVEDGAG